MVTSVAPNHGPTSGGTVVTIYGANLFGATQVLFGTVAVSITPNSGSTITVMSPAASSPSIPSVADVRVVVSSVTSAAVAADRFTYTTNCISALLTPDAPSPQSVGTVVTFNASSYGCPLAPVRVLARLPEPHLGEDASFQRQLCLDLVYVEAPPGALTPFISGPTRAVPPLNTFQAFASATYTLVGCLGGALSASPSSPRRPGAHGCNSRGPHWAASTRGTSSGSSTRTGHG